MDNVVIEWRREHPPGQPFGAVHLELHTRGAPRSRVSICGMATNTMSKRSTPFNGWRDVLCPLCEEGLEF